MTETGKFLQRRATLAGLVAIPIAASCSVVLGEDDDRLLCNVADSAPPAAPYDCVSEDDGEP